MYYKNYTYLLYKSSKIYMKSPIAVYALHQQQQQLFQALQSSEQKDRDNQFTALKIILNKNKPHKAAWLCNCCGTWHGLLFIIIIIIIFLVIIWK